MALLENRRSWENQKPLENRQKSGLFWASPFTMHLVCTLLRIAQSATPSRPESFHSDTDLFSRVIFSFLPPLLATPFPPLFLGTASPFSPSRTVLSSVEQRAQRRAWRGAVPGWTSPQSSGRKFLPEICVKKGQDIKEVLSEGREWGGGSVVVESAFLGRPDFQSSGPQTLILKGGSFFAYSWSFFAYSWASLLTVP